MNSELLKRVFKRIDRYKYLLIVVAAGIVLLLLPPFPAKTENKSKQQSEPVIFSVSEEEKRIARALSAAAGLGKTEVVLTLRSTMETIYQSDMNEDTSVSSGQSENRIVTETVIVSLGSGMEQAVVRKKIYPEYRGALVICEGADKPSVVLKVINAMKALTGLPADKITVLGRHGK
jgi:stage III sporulation protein AG